MKKFTFSMALVAILIAVLHVLHRDDLKIVSVEYYGHVQAKDISIILVTFNKPLSNKLTNIRIDEEEILLLPIGLNPRPTKEFLIQWPGKDKVPEHLKDRPVKIGG